MTEAIPMLPPELYDHILDQLHDDRPTLRNCALTTRSWLPRAQHHIFHSVYLDWSNCTAFSRLLASNPSLADYVGTLEIEGAFGIFSMDRLHGATLDAWLRAVPPWLPPRLANLTKLELALLTIDSDLSSRFFNSLHGVKHLTLWACALTAFDVFAEMYLSFPKLTRLTIAFTQEWETNPHPVVPLVRSEPRPQVEVIELTSSCDDFKVLKWLVAEDLHRAIHMFSCTRVPWAALCTLGDMLNAFSPTLRTLRIGLGDSMTATDLPRGTGWACPTFTPLPVLTTLTLDIHTARLSAVPYTLYLLAQLSAPALRTLAFAVKCGEFDTAFLIPWMRIAEVSARFVPSGLACVRVSVRERERPGAPPLVHVDTMRGTVGAGGHVDLAEMERSVRGAFGAQGMGGLVTFERVAR
ncbi:hypothetical protein C2E23DRAFT_877601 [Lenzites betulinus]|nr:hypothetical protein C2E23DRAFT_877601 [Lenzites betulinus]